MNSHVRETRTVGAAGAIGAPLQGVARRADAEQRAHGIVDFDRLNVAISAMDHASDFEAAEIALSEVSLAIGMPVLAWAPDVARPAFDPLMDAFMRRQGWRGEDLALWWDKGAMLKTPVYIRCRTRAMPFVTRIEPLRADIQPELRRIAASMREMGASSLITVPVHLPRGQVAMVSFGGLVDLEGARARLGAARPALLAAGHFLMAAYEKTAHLDSSTEEELVRLTPREWECLRLTAQGCREEEVATLVQIGATTVRFHLDNVVRKLGASNRLHAVARAAQLGMLGPIG